MLKGKQTDTIHWRERLQNLESLAGEEAPDKQAAWENLHNRLYKKSARKTTWYWAAASLLLLLAVPFLLVERGHETGTYSTVQKKLPTTAPVINQLNKKDDAVIILNKPAEKTAVQYVTEKKPARNCYKWHLTTAGRPVVINSMIPGAGGITVNPPLLGTIDSIKPVMVLAAARQKLKVVNINETDAGSEALFTGQFKKHKHIDIKFGGKNGSGTAMVSQQIPAGFHKLKIPLTN